MNTNQTQQQTQANAFGTVQQPPASGGFQPMPFQPMGGMQGMGGMNQMGQPNPMMA